jgi:hypothetical protein
VYEQHAVVSLHQWSVTLPSARNRSRAHQRRHLRQRPIVDDVQQERNAFFWSERVEVRIQSLDELPPLCELIGPAPSAAIHTNSTSARDGSCPTA